jgi:hypothetical protein
MSQRVSYKKGEIVLDYKSTADKFYIVIVGEAQAVFPPEFHEKNKKRLSTVPRSKKYIPGDYFDLQYLLTPNMVAGCMVVASSELILLTINAVDFNWFLRESATYERLEKLIHTRHDFAWDAISSNSVFCKLTELQRTQLELILTKWDIAKNYEVWHADEACDIGVFIAKGEFVLKTWIKAPNHHQHHAPLATEKTAAPRKRKTSSNVSTHTYIYR